MLPLLAALIGAAALSPAAAQDDAMVKRGQLLFLQCRTCHSIKAGEPDKVGPNLAGVIGRKSASRPGYAYSAAMKAAGLTWDAATLDRYLTAPAKLVPGNKMGFGGIATPADRAAVIAYIDSASK